MIRGSELTPASRLIVMDRPARRNALDLPAVDSFREELAAVVRSGCRSVVVQGAGGNFCAGGDLKAVAAEGEEYARQLGARGQALTQELERAPLLTISLIEGACVGGGAEIALACDVRVAVASSYWQFPEVKAGAIPAWGGTQKLPRHVGLARAKQLLLTARRLSSESLVPSGLVASLWPDRDAAWSEVKELVSAVAATSWDAFRYVKRLLDLSYDVSATAGAWAELSADALTAADFVARARSQVR